MFDTMERTLVVDHRDDNSEPDGHAALSRNVTTPGWFRLVPLTRDPSLSLVPCSHRSKMSHPLRVYV